MLALLIVVFLLSPTISVAQSAPPQEQTEFELLPRDDLFRPLFAGVREPQFSIRYERQKIRDERFNGAGVSFGDSLPLFNLKLEDDSTWQLSFEGAMYAIFNLDTDSYDLINTDYIVGFSLAREKQDWSYRFKVFHVSGHLGDELVLDNPDIERKNTSYEDAEFIIARNFNNTRLYFGGGYVFRTNSELQTEPWHGRVGIEWRTPLSDSGMDFLTGVDISTLERSDWKPNTSVTAGVRLIEKHGKEIRLMSFYYHGSSPNGQFFRERIDYWGLGIYFLI